VLAELNDYAIWVKGIAQTLLDVVNDTEGHRNRSTDDWRTRFLKLSDDGI
jgi:hypothetical protein